MTKRDQQLSFGGDENVPYLDYDASFMGRVNCQNSWNFTLLMDGIYYM